MALPACEMFILCAGPDPDLLIPDNNMVVCTVPEEQKVKKQTQQMPLSGAELAAMMKIGTRVMRGVDWKWGDQVSFKLKLKLEGQLNNTT